VTRRDLTHHPFIGLFVGTEAVDSPRDEPTTPQIVDGLLENLDVPQDIVPHPAARHPLDPQYLHGFPIVRGMPRPHNSGAGCGRLASVSR
jgi:hypothetical protein